MSLTPSIPTFFPYTTLFRSMQGLVRDRVEDGASVYTDSLKSYVGLDRSYVHNVIDHAETYVDGQVHTNGLENFWSLLKRGLKRSEEHTSELQSHSDLVCRLL